MATDTGPASCAGSRGREALKRERAAVIANSTLRNDHSKPWATNLGQGIEWGFSSGSAPRNRRRVHSGEPASTSRDSGADIVRSDVRGDQPGVLRLRYRTNDLVR